VSTERDAGRIEGRHPPAARPDAPAVVEQLERLLASHDFDASSRGRALLRFVVGEMLANRQESLSLAVIARRVFRRGEDFDPRLDPAVRIEVARLGRALGLYNRLAGAGDPVCISLPRAACVPVARWAPARTAREIPEDTGASAAATRR
jgi:hypothetical protein